MFLFCKFTAKHKKINTVDYWNSPLIISGINTVKKKKRSCSDYLSLVNIYSEDRVLCWSEKEPLGFNWNLILRLPELLPSYYPLKKKTSPSLFLFCLFASIIALEITVLSRLIVTYAKQMGRVFLCFYHLCLSPGKRGFPAGLLIIPTEKPGLRGRIGGDLRYVVTQTLPEYSHGQFLWVVHLLILLHFQGWFTC